MNSYCYYISDFSPAVQLYSGFTNLHVATCLFLLDMQNMATSSTTKSGKTLDPKVMVHMLRALQLLCVKYLDPR